jgi:hypothetical protein
LGWFRGGAEILEGGRLRDTGGVREDAIRHERASLAVISGEKSEAAATSARASAPASKAPVQWAMPSASPGRSKALP